MGGAATALGHVIADVTDPDPVRYGSNNVSSVVLLSGHTKPVKSHLNQMKIRGLIVSTATPACSCQTQEKVATSPIQWANGR